MSARVRFLDWWRKPPTARDRILGAVVGGIAGFWVSLLCALAYLQSPQPLSSLALVALLGATAGAALGAALPKPITCVLYPFALVGGGS